MTDQQVVWKRRATVSTLANSTPIPLTFVQELEGVVVRCSKCGQIAASVRRKPHLWGMTSYYTHCRACHQESGLGGERAARSRIAEVAPQILGEAFS